MNQIIRNFRHRCRVYVYCAFFLLIFAVTEISIMELFSPLFDRAGLLTSGLLDAVILSLLYAFPLWFFIFQPFRLREREVESASPINLNRLFLETLAAIFVIEFLVMLFIGVFLPGIDPRASNFLDAGITVAVFAMFFLTVLRRMDLSMQRGVFLSDITVPLKLYGLLLLVVFLADFIESMVLLHLAVDVKRLNRELIDPFIFTVVAAPFIWMVLVKPFKRAAEAEKVVCDTLQAQVVDAIIAADEQGVIHSFNPAAERIFGYAAADILGMRTELLLNGDQPLLDEMVREVVAGARSGRCAVSWEMAGWHRDGTVIYLDVSVSRVVLFDRQMFLLNLRDIGARKAMDEALRASEERFRIVAAAANEGIWDCDLASGRLYFTPRFVEMLGFREGELEHSFAAVESLMHPEDHDRVMEEVGDHLTRRTPFTTECRLRTRSGAYLWFGIRGQAVWNADGKAVRLAGAVNDITGRKEAEQALRDSTLRFRQIFEQIEDAVLFFKPGTCSIIDMNPATTRLYGYQRDELMAGGLPLVCRADHLTRVCISVSGIQRGESLALDNIIHCRKDGGEIVVSIRGKMMTLQGVDIVYCSFRDVTERIRMEEEARHIQARLIQANKMTSLGLLVSGVAHEINNPNNYILTNAQVLAKVWDDAVKLLHECYGEQGEFYLGGLPFTEVSSQSSRMFADIIDGTRRIDAIISNLKRFAREERTDLDQEVDVNFVITTAVSILHHEIVKYTRNFNLELAETLPPVLGSSQQLGQVVINLLMNACQSLPDKERAIWVISGYDLLAGQVTITVRDQGAGMPRDVSGRILEPFFTTKLDNGGTGLGLSISQSIIKEHDGLLEFESEAGKGTTFTVRLPAVKSIDKEHIK